MKKTLALILALMTVFVLLAACGEQEKTPTEQTGEQPGGNPVDKPQEKPVAREFESPEVEAIIVTAEAFLARRTYIQYDDTRLVTGNVSPVTYRWQRLTCMPEDYTKQMTGYSNCAAFTYDVYWTALGYDIAWWSTQQLTDQAKEMQVFYHKVTGTETDEDRARIQKEYMDIIKPGDIVVMRYQGNANGHAMLYVGGDNPAGDIIHCSAPGGGNYDYGGKKELSEPAGSLAYMKLSDLFNPSNSRAFFQNDSFCLVRPLKTFTGTIPESTQNRVKNLQGVVVQKLSSHTIGMTADLGEEITFTYEINNGNKYDVTLDVTDKVPANTTYVSGCDNVSGDDLKWNVTIPAGKNTKIAYKVKVKNDEKLYDGGYVWGKDGKVGGVSVKCTPVFIGAALDKGEQTSITNAIKALDGNSKLQGMELVKKVYEDALAWKLDIGTEKEVINGIFKTYDASHNELDLDGDYYDMLVPTMYGGYNVVNSSEFLGMRTRGPQSTHLMAGDIIICSLDAEGKTTTSFMYAGDNKVLTLDEGTAKLLSLVESKDALMSIIGYYMCAIVRPSLVY